MLTKQQVISAIEKMPDSFDTAQLFDRILLLKKVEEGKNANQRRKSVDHRTSQKKIKEMAEVIWSPRGYRFLYCCIMPPFYCQLIV